MFSYINELLFCWLMVAVISLESKQILESIVQQGKEFDTNKSKTAADEP